jgi:tRNA modification GTPase
LSQAEAVADIIASENESQHRLAIKQMRGGYSDIIESLRQELIDFAALLELELDFSEEDVEFADRKKFLDLIQQMLTVIEQMIRSFQFGNVIKQGIPIAIVGKPNVGKSTLLNALLREEKAIVSELAGTTRDFIEDTLQIHGIQYRFIDTAGIRETTDVLESKGIERSFEKIRQAEIILYMADIQESVDTIISDFQLFPFLPEQKVIILLNKSDIGNSSTQQSDSKAAVATLSGRTTIELSAREKRNIDTVISVIEAVSSEQTKSFDYIVSNARHLEAFQQAKASLLLVQKGLQEKMSGDFISIDVRTALYALGTITGKISSEDVLSSVFGRFCIGK